MNESSEQSNPVDRLKEAYDGLTDREQVLLKAMFGVFAVLALSVVVFLAQQSVVELEEETARYQTALQLLAAEGPAYAREQAGGDTDTDDWTRVDLFTDEVLRDNPISLTSYVERNASAVGVNVTNYDPHEEPLGGRDDEGPLIIERQLQIDIRGSKMDDLVEMLHRLEESREPIVIKRLDIGSVRAEGEVRAQVSVSTFEYGDDDEES